MSTVDVFTEPEMTLETEPEMTLTEPEMTLETEPEMTITVEVVNMDPRDISIISAVYDKTKTIDEIESQKRISNLMDEIQDLKDENFGYKFFNYIPNDVIIAFNGNKIVGYCGLNFENGLHVESLCVDENYRHNGIGRSILEKAYEIGKNLNKKLPTWEKYIKNDMDGNSKCLTLEVERYAPNYRGLQTFYEKCGFEEINRIGYIEARFTKII